MNKEYKTLLINKELTRIGIPLEHEHASYFRDGYLFAQKQALTIPVVTSTLPNIDSTEFRNWLKSELYEQTLNRFVYKRGGFEYDKDVLYKHYTNQLQFGN